MAKIHTTRGAQCPVVAEFTFNFDDTMEDINGATVNFSSVGAKVVKAIHLPIGAVVVGGSVVTEAAATGPTAYNITVGDSLSANRYLGTTNRAAAGITNLVPTGFVGDGEDIRVTVEPTVAPATTGKFTVRVEFITRGRVTEVYTT
jgi:hypothetical protein